MQRNTKQNHHGERKCKMTKDFTFVGKTLFIKGSWFPDVQKV